MQCISIVHSALSTVHAMLCNTLNTVHEVFALTRVGCNAMH